MNQFGGHVSADIGKMLVFLIIFATTMSNEKRNNTKYWAMMVISGIALTYFTIFLPEAFWLGLPTFFGGLAMAMDWV
jgi:hypothetical protein